MKLDCLKNVYQKKVIKQTDLINIKMFIRKKVIKQTDKMNRLCPLAN